MVENNRYTGPDRISTNILTRKTAILMCGTRHQKPTNKFFRKWWLFKRISRNNLHTYTGNGTVPRYLEIP
jgi:hypothetical protein